MEPQPALAAQSPLAEPTLFEAAIVPHRSLSAAGMKVLLGLIGAMGVYITALLSLLGAWPAIGFLGAEVGLAILLIRCHGRARRQCELVLLSASALRIVRTDARGRQREKVLSPGWLNVLLQERRGRVPLLLLAARGTREEIGAALGEQEKRDLARTLSEALHRLRNPRFDNPQLHE